MRRLTIASDASIAFTKLSVSIASTAEEVREVQRLRYKVFIEAMGLSALANPHGLDRDEYDEVCDHLIVRDNRTLKVVGTYRVLSPRNAREHGRLYSEQEFELSRLAHLRGRMMEAGRACIHPDYRGGAVLSMLWGALAALMKREGCDYLVGCGSLSLADGGRNAAAVYHQLAREHMAPAEYRVTPHLALPLHHEEPGVEAVVPALIRGYLKSGAWICGEPAWDADFHCADLFLMLSMARMEQRYARHYLRERAALAA
jgi:putative hemolysin